MVDDDVAVSLTHVLVSVCVWARANLWMYAANQSMEIWRKLLRIAWRTNATKSIQYTNAYGRKSVVQGHFESRKSVRFVSVWVRVFALTLLLFTCRATIAIITIIAVTTVVQIKARTIRDAHSIQCVNGWMDGWLRKRTARQYKSGFTRLRPPLIPVRIIRSFVRSFDVSFLLYLRLGSVGVRMNFAIRCVTSAITEMNHRDRQSWLAHSVCVCVCVRYFRFSTSPRNVKYFHQNWTVFRMFFIG